MKSCRFVLCLPFLLVAALWSPSAPGAPLSSDASGSKADTNDARKDSTKPPFKGMTETQARHSYGDPDSIGHRAGGELWTYVLNRGENISKIIIPFHFSDKIRYRLLNFKNGKVVNFHWDPPPRE